MLIHDELILIFFFFLRLSRYFCKNKSYGKGRVIHANGNIYEGEFRNDMAEGQGVFTWPDGRRYEGELRNNAKEFIIGLRVED